MIDTKKTLILVNGERLGLPLSVEAAKRVYAINLSITGITADGTSKSAYQNNVVKTQLHVTEDQLIVAGWEVPTEKEKLGPSITDSLLDILENLGVRFED